MYFVANGEAVKTSNTTTHFKIFKCDQYNYTNFSEKGLTQHMCMKHCPSLDLRCSRQEHFITLMQHRCYRGVTEIYYIITN